MGRIRILSDNVANKIAAGEVVERPASVVKELLENSLDAAASEFRLEIEAGGRKLIRLADNGSGMMRDDALLAFERHATSKLSDVKRSALDRDIGISRRSPAVHRVRFQAAARNPGSRGSGWHGRRVRRRTIAAVRRSRTGAGHNHHGSRSVLQRACAQEVPAVGSVRNRARGLTGNALQPGAPGQELFAAPYQRGTVERHAGGIAARARLSGVREPDSGRPGGSGRAVARIGRCCRSPTKLQRCAVSACVDSSAGRRCRS